jgi:hypothetical protein
VNEDKSEMERALHQIMKANVKLRDALAFAASCIKSGEKWSSKCDEIIEPLLHPEIEP